MGEASKIALELKELLARDTSVVSFHVQLRELYSRAASVVMTPELLKESKLAFSFNDVRKSDKCNDKDLLKNIKDLLRKWQTCIAVSAGVSGGVEDSSDAPKKTSRPEGIEGDHEDRPKKIQATDQAHDRPVKTEPTVKAEKPAVGTKPADDGQQETDEVVLGKNKTDHRYRDIVSEHLAKCLNRKLDIPNEYTVKQKTLRAIDIERAMYTHYGSVDGNYKDRFLMLKSNFNDEANAQLIVDVLSGIILPEELVSMKEEELHSMERREDIRKIRELETQKLRVDAGAPVASEPGMYVCRKCNCDRCTYYQKQTRSADEPMTTFITCSRCGFKWREN